MLENIIKNDIIKEITNYFNRQKINYSSNSDYNSLVIQLLDIANKRVFPRKRTVHYSNELKHKIVNDFTEIEQNTIKYFEKSFTDGDDINGHLSKSVYTSKQYDSLLNSWNIRHLHFNIKKAKNFSEMSKNRSDKYLLFLLSSYDVYFIDVVKHLHGAEFGSFDFLNIIYKNNWMHCVPAYELNDVIDIQPKITCKEDIFLCWKKGINPSVFSFGNRYFMVGLGISSVGNRVEDSFNLINLNKSIRKISNMDGLKYKHVEIMNGNSLISIIAELNGRPYSYNFYKM